MRKTVVLALAVFGISSARPCHLIAQSVLTAPTGNQTITQPSGTSLTIAGSGTLNAGQISVSGAFVGSSYIRSGNDPLTGGADDLLLQAERYGAMTLDVWSGTDQNNGTLSVLLPGLASLGDFEITDADAQNTFFCADTVQDYVGVGGQNACAPFDLLDISNREAFGNGYMHWFLSGAAESSWNAGFSNPAAGVISVDTSVTGDSAGTIKVGKVQFSDGTSLSSASSGNLNVTSSQNALVTIQSTTPAGGGQGSFLLLDGNDRNWSLNNWNSGNGGLLPGSLGIVDGTAGIVRALFDPAGNIYLGNKTGNGLVDTSSLSLLANGYVGVDTIHPTVPLEVNGSIKTDAGGVIFPDGSTQTVAANFLSTSSGASASQYLTLNANGGIPSYIGNVVNGQNVFSYNTYYSGTSWMYGANGPTAAIRMAPGFAAMAFYTTPSGTGGSANSTMDTTGPKMSLSQTGGLSLGNGYVGIDPGAGSLVVAKNVGIGTATPGIDLVTPTLPAASVPPAGTPILQVNGDITFTQNTTSGFKGGQVIFSDQTVQTTAWNGTTFGQDYAESVDIRGDRSTYEPGDVIVIDSAETSKFDKSDSAYSKMVAGVYSTKPGLLAQKAIENASDKGMEVPMAMMGMVPTKVSTENGPIERGDLLVSSNTPGYAMKGTDRDRLTGAIIGKALAPLKSGKGVIAVLLALQ